MLYVMLQYMTPFYTPGDIILANLAFALPIALGVLGVGLAIAFAIWYGYAGKIRDFLRDSKIGQVDEKIGIIYIHANSALQYERADANARMFWTQRIRSDIRALGRIKDSIDTPQREDLTVAMQSLVREMSRLNLTEEAEQIRTVFYQWLWPF
jgi:hypothetical protein